MRRSIATAAAPVLLAVITALALMFALPKSAFAAPGEPGEWCGSFGAGAAWDAASATCTVTGNEVLLRADVTIGQAETLYVTSDVLTLTLEAGLTNHGAVALWAVDTENAGKINNYGVLAAVGSFANRGDFWNYGTLRIFETFTNYGVLTNEGEIDGAVNSAISNLGTISNVRRSRFTSEGTIDNRGTFLADCGATLTYDPARFTGSTILGLTGCDGLEPKAAPAVRAAPNGDTLVLWNWRDNEGGAGIDLLHCQAFTRLRGPLAGDTEVTAVCRDRAGNRGRAVYVVTAPQGPPACDARVGRITVRLDPQPALAGEVRIWGPYGVFALDGDDRDGDAAPASKTYTDVLPGTHTFAASVPFGWALAQVSCTPGANCEVDITQHRAAIRVAACEDVTAVFALVQRGTVAVHTYVDENVDGQPQTDEPGWGPVWTELTARAADGGTRLVASGFTDPAGAWSAGGLLPGLEHTLCQAPPAGWTNTQPGLPAADDRGWVCYRFTLQAGEAAASWFGYAAGEPVVINRTLAAGGWTRSPEGQPSANTDPKAAAGLWIGPAAPDRGVHLFLPNVAGD